MNAIHAKLFGGKGLTGMKALTDFETGFTNFEEDFGKFFTPSYLAQTKNIIWDFIVSPSTKTDAIDLPWSNNEVSNTVVKHVKVFICQVRASRSISYV